MAVLGERDRIGRLLGRVVERFGDPNGRRVHEARPQLALPLVSGRSRFDRPDAAIRCAVEIQRALARHRVDHGFAPGVRIGLHEAEATREGSDYQGRGVHEAARIAGAADGDEILISSPVAAHVPDGSLVASLNGVGVEIDVCMVDLDSNVPMERTRKCRSRAGLCGDCPA